MLLLLPLQSILLFMQYKFNNSVVGGTFDRFHVGHRKLLETAFEQSEKVDIGIATNELFKDKQFAHLIEDYEDRRKSVMDFLSQRAVSARARLIPINDFYGTTLQDMELDAIFVTESNREHVLKINEEREKRGIRSLEIVSVPFVRGNDKEIISSERIRKGLIDRDGNSYKKLFEAQEEFVLTEKERDELRQPIGKITKDMKDVLSVIDDKTLLIAVGDIVAASVQQAGRLADINIIDGKTRRHNLETTNILSDVAMTHRATENPAGIITQEAANTLFAAMKDYNTTRTKQLIDVTGEEDLLAIPAILLAPLHTVVLYGQFDKGIVVVSVSEQNKKRVQELFRKFQ